VEYQQNLNWFVIPEQLAHTILRSERRSLDIEPDYYFGGRHQPEENPPQLSLGG
jgi:hypothetical protein